MRYKIYEHSKGGLAVKTPYDRGFVNDLKNSIPNMERAWDNMAKAWIVHYPRAKSIRKMIKRHYHRDVGVPKFSWTKPVVERGVFSLVYVGSSKAKNGDVAFGMDWKTSKWTVILPLMVLQNWFDGRPITDTHPSQGSTLSKDSHYRVLQFKDVETDQAKIKSAWRRMCMQWHPDYCKEPNANDMFIKINGAYNILSDDRKKRKYDLGIQMQREHAGTPKKRKVVGYFGDDYYPALRCGLVKAEYEMIVGRAVLHKIAAWDDIVDKNSKTMISTWIYPEKMPTVMWV